MENEEILTFDEEPEEFDIPVVSEVVVFDERPFMHTPLNEYSVTEGLLLLLLLFFVGRSIMGWIKEGFFWLW